MSSTTTNNTKIWRVLWTAKRWDYENYLQSVRENKTVPMVLGDKTVLAGGLPFALLPQAKGKAQMVSNTPKRGDKVIFVVCGLGTGKDWIEVADGVVCDEFQTGKEHQIYPFILGDSGEHLEVEEFARVYVTPRNKDNYTITKKGDQRTWKIIQ